MPNSILEEFYLGNISPCEDQKSYSPEMKKHQKTISDLEERLLQSLTGHDRDLFKKFSDSYLSLNERTAAASFLQGFRIGGLMMTDLFCGWNSAAGAE